MRKAEQFATRNQGFFLPNIHNRRLSAYVTTCYARTHHARPIQENSPIAAILTLRLLKTG